MRNGGGFCRTWREEGPGPAASSSASWRYRRPALLFRTACPWRLPPRDFPKRSTVQRYIYAWQAKGLLEKVNFLLVEQARERGGSKASPPTRHPGSRRRWLLSATSSHGCAKSPAFARAGFCRWCLRAGNKLETALAGRGSGRWSSDPTTLKVFKYCSGDGSSSGPSPGLGAIA